MFHYANSKNPKLTHWPLQPQKNNKPNETEISKNQKKNTKQNTHTHTHTHTQIRLNPKYLYMLRRCTSLRNEHFTALGISHGATAKEIKHAFREQTKRHHPDVGGDPEQFKRICNAYSILSGKSHSQARTKLHRRNHPHGLGAAIRHSRRSGLHAGKLVQG